MYLFKLLFFINYPISNLRFSGILHTRHYAVKRAAGNKSTVFYFSDNMLCMKFVEMCLKEEYYFPYFRSNKSLFFLPHSNMASMIGIKVIPREVMEYSDRGGSSG